MARVVHHIVLNALQAPLLPILDFFLLNVNFLHLFLVETFDFFKEIFHLFLITNHVIFCICNLLSDAPNRHFNIVFCLI